MANKKISQLDPIGTIDVNQDSIPIVDYSENVTKRTNLANIGQRVLEASSTTNLAEGTNLYFTNTRVYTKVKATLLAGSNTSITFDDALQTITIASQGNVQSVNTKTGAVVLTTTDITEGTNQYFTAARVRAVVLTGLSLATNAVISATDSVLIAFGKLQAQITANLSTLTSHTSNTSNPHATTKAQVGLGDADNTSDANKPISIATQTALDGKVDENTAITGATKTKVTYDSKGLVTAGADATTADIADSTNKHYVTDAQLVVIGNTSGTNTGDQTLTGLGGVPTTRTLTINGTTQDLSANRTFTIATGITIGTTPITSGTVGRIFFEGTGNVVSESANLFWDNTNGRLGIGTSSPARAIDIVKTIASGAIDGIKIEMNHSSSTSAGILDFIHTQFDARCRIQSVAGAGGANPTLSFIIRSLNAMNIFQSGNIGINTLTDAGFKLDVGGTARVQGAIDVTGTITSTASGFALFKVGGNGVRMGNLTFDAGGLATTNGASSGSLTWSSANYSWTLNRFLTIAGSLTVNTSITAASALAQGVFFNNTLVAAANNDVLVGLDINPTFTNGAFTGVTNLAARIQGNLDVNGTARVQNKLSVGTPTQITALLEVTSTTQGFLPPRMTTTEKNAITSPATGLMVYDTTLNVITYYNGTTWI